MAWQCRLQPGHIQLPTRRLIFDISTLARSGGPPDGTVRTARSLASWAFTHRHDTVFVIYDTRAAALRCARKEWITSILDGSAKVDTTSLPDPWTEKRRFRERFPAPMRNLIRWIQRPRRQAFVALERWRLRTNSTPRLAWLWGLQESLISDKYWQELSGPNNTRRTLIPYEMAVGAAIDLDSTDILVLAGSDWGTLYLSDVLRHPPKIAVLCYDIIPLLFPEFYPEKTVRGFKEYFHRLLPRADLVIFNATQVERDSRDYCAAHGLQLKKTGVVPLGSDFTPVDTCSPAQLPAGLEKGHYALFVSTIEPRKGHRLLLSVWERLLAEGVPQATGFKLVFVGRRGWLVDDLLNDLDNHAANGKSLFVFSNASDETLASLYAQSAFCLFPSLYEGYGLPVIEGFRYGKAVLASSGGALREVVGEFSPCLDPRSTESWYTMLKQWILDPGTRVPF